MLLRPSEAADILRISVKTIKRWEKMGRISSTRINKRGDRRYTREGVDKIIRGEA